MNSKSPFKWRHFAPNIILWGVCWYYLYPITYRQLSEMMCDRGVEVDYSTLYRWVQKYAPEPDKRCCQYLRPTNNSRRVEISISAVDSDRNTLDFLITAKRFFCKVLNAVHTQDPRVINIDKNAAYPRAIDELKAKEELSEQAELRQKKYLNNIIEQDHQGIKRLVSPGMGFGSFNTARRTIKGYEIMNMIRKGQIEEVERGAVQNRIKFIAELFGVAAWTISVQGVFCFQQVFATQPSR